MKLLYAYFDFEDGLAQSGSYRELGECGLNFSTTHSFVVKKEKASVENGNAPVYFLSCREKEEQDRLPKDFWISRDIQGNRNSKNKENRPDNRIYNITALVGGNGVGKSSLIHSLIKTIVMGLDPGFPFVLVLQKTESEKMLIYHSSKVRLQIPEDSIIRENLDEADIIDHEKKYEKTGLKKAKIILLDNTLSVSAIEMDQTYDHNKPFQAEEPLPDFNPVPIQEAYKQLYNKSLFSSVRYSNEMSKANQHITASTVTEDLLTHFRYESYQEIRYLFDQFQQSAIRELTEAHYPFPRPRFVYLQAFDVYVLQETKKQAYAKRNKERFDAPNVCSSMFTYGFWGRIIEDALYVLYNTAIENLFAMRDQHTVVSRIITEIDRIFNAKQENRNSFSIAGKAILDVVDKLSEKMDAFLQKLQEGEKREEPVRNTIAAVNHSAVNCRRFIQFIIENQKKLDLFFRPVSKESFEDLQIGETRFDRKIDIEAVNADPELNKCVIGFLNAYRKASEGSYFLLFQTGLSSGEKNLLRMMTQFRYALAGPPIYEEDTNSEKNTHNKLASLFFDKTKGENVEVSCDTLFLFLDEADLTYHPEWQRQFISLLTAFLPKMFRDPYDDGGADGCKDIQVILATHSPLMLSDIPLQSCIFLEKEETNPDGAGRQEPDSGKHYRVVVKDNASMRQTLGANIHGLISDAFFLQRTIGEFAYKKITEIFRELQALKEHPEDSQLRKACRPLAKEISLIGDPLIRNKLLSIYNACFPESKGLVNTLSAVAQIPEMGETLTDGEREKVIEELERAADRLRRHGGGQA